MTRQHVLLEDHGYPLIWQRSRLALTVLGELATLVALFVGLPVAIWVLGQAQ